MPKNPESVIRAANTFPSPRQEAWQRVEFYAFVHFGINTFTDREWGEGTEDPALFNPAELDCRQWAAAAKAAGMRGLVLTAKHHDGFCLWPSAYTGHSVKNSPWRDGQGDVVAEAAEACRAYGLKFGLYLSPWDRHEPAYGQGKAYDDYYCAQLEELTKNYGELFCLWFDGACGEGPNGKRQSYDFNRYFEIIRKNQPEAVISICGPDVRWCGNEAGSCRVSEWSVIPAGPYQYDAEDLGSRGVIEGRTEFVWSPAEVDTSIRPGWFYHAAEDDRVRGLPELLDIYFNAVGGNAALILNIPPDRRGLFHENDAARLREIGRYLGGTFSRNMVEGAKVFCGCGDASAVLDGSADTCFTPPGETEEFEITLELARTAPVDMVVLGEYIRKGQRIERFEIDISENGSVFRTVFRGTVVGWKKICRFPASEIRFVRLRVTGSRLAPSVREMALYCERENAVRP